MGKQKAHRRHKEILKIRREYIQRVPEKSNKSVVHVKKAYFRRRVFKSACPTCGRQFKKTPSEFSIYVCKYCCSVFKFVVRSTCVEAHCKWGIVGELVEILHIPWNFYLLDPKWHIPIISF